MIRYFLETAPEEKVTPIKDLLNKKKKRIECEDFSAPFLEYEESTVFFTEILEESKLRNHEDLANANYVFQQYFLLFCHLSKYFELLRKHEYKNSWDALQDTFDQARHVGKFTTIENRMEIPDIINLLLCYEGLYPYSIFSSSEFVISKARCSICDKSMQSLECMHIKGNLYWGEVAKEIVEKVETFQAVCLVSHPQDKRCILELADDNRTENEKFKKIDLFLNLSIPVLQKFGLDSQIESRKRDDYSNIGRNDPCPCRSGKKYKKCCGNELFYQHERNIISPENMVILTYI